jgi:hypothetical protein
MLDDMIVVYVVQVCSVVTKNAGDDREFVNIRTGLDHQML